MFAWTKCRTRPEFPDQLILSLFLSVLYLSLPLWCPVCPRPRTPSRPSLTFQFSARFQLQTGFVIYCYTTLCKNLLYRDLQVLYYFNLLPWRYKVVRFIISGRCYLKTSSGLLHRVSVSKTTQLFGILNTPHVIKCLNLLIITMRPFRSVNLSRCIWSCFIVVRMNCCYNYCKIFVLFIII